MIHSTGNIDLSNLNSDYDDYSEGETSEDMKIQAANSLFPPKHSFFKTIDQHLSSIQYDFIDSCTEYSTFQYADKDFLLDLPQEENSLFNESANLQTDVVYVIVPHPAQFSKIESEFVSNKPSVFAWQNSINAIPNEFNIAVNQYYKSSYLYIKKQLHVTMMVSPSAEKLNTFSNFRRDGFQGRALFHYVGYGFPPVDKNSIWICDGRPNIFKQYPITKLFESIKTPSWYIFDCNNAASVIPTFELISQRNSRKTAAVPQSPPTNRFFAQSMDWDDWMCLCVTDVGENLPVDPRLPRDFLSTALFAPVSLSILCHILQYFRASFNNSQFPLNVLDTILNVKIERPTELDVVLEAIIDGIVSDFLDDNQIKLFRGDPVVASAFRSFVLCQFLLEPYDIHPTSRPQLPSMVKHPLWLQWRSALDQWITSSLTPPPHFIEFFDRALATFERFPDKMLSIITHIPFAKGAPRGPSLVQLTKYSSLSTENLEKVLKTIEFRKLFDLLSLEMPPVEFQALAFLVLCLINSNNNLLYKINPEFDFGKLFGMALDRRIDPSTRILVTSICALLLNTVKTTRRYVTTPEFMQFFTKIKEEPPALSQWLFLMLRNGYQSVSADSSTFFPSSIHIQVSSFTRHPSHFVRAAALGALPVFMNDDCLGTTAFLVLLSLPLFSDASFAVRAVLNDICTMFLGAHASSFIDVFRRTRLTATALTFTQLMQQWLGPSISCNSDFGDVARAADAVVKSDDGIQRVCSAAFTVIDMLSHDPHPFIKKAALKSRAFFQQLAAVEGGAESRSHSISPPFQNLYFRSNSAHSDDDEVTEESDFSPIDSTSVNLTALAANRLVSHRFELVKPIKPLSKPPQKQQPANIIEKEKEIPRPRIQMANPVSNSKTDAVSKGSARSTSSVQHTLGFGRSGSFGRFVISSPSPTKRDGRGPRSMSQSQRDQPPQHESAKEVGEVKNCGKVKVELKARSRPNSFAATHVAMGAGGDFAVSTVNKWVFALDDACKVVGKVRLSDFEVSSLQFSTILDTPMVVAATADGCVHLWDYTRENPTAVLRADANYNCDSVPQLVACAGQRLFTSRGNSGVAVWDLARMQLVGEWRGDEQHIATALALAPGGGQCAVVGYSNGGLDLVDTRDPSSRPRRLTVSLGGRISSLSSNGDLVYAATAEGKAAIWDMVTCNLAMIAPQDSNGPVRLFKAHAELPFTVCSGSKKTPLLEGPDGRMVAAFEGVAPGSVFDTHPTLPRVAFGSPAGDVSLYTFL